MRRGKFGKKKAAYRFRFRGYVLRPQFVTIKAQNAKGEAF